MGINENLEEIKELLKENKEEKKEKKWKLPFKAKVSPARAKQGYVGVLKINENGYITPSKEKIEEQTIMVDGVPRLATADYILHLNKNPLIILPSWSVEPISPSKSFEVSMNNGTNIKGYKLLMNKMKLATVEGKKQVGSWLKWVIGLVLVGIIIYAIFFTGGNA
jgi:hypothetical protein